MHYCAELSCVADNNAMCVREAEMFVLTVPGDVVLYLVVSSLSHCGHTKLNVESHVMQSDQQQPERSHVSSLSLDLLWIYSVFFLHIGWKARRLMRCLCFC